MTDFRDDAYRADVRRDDNGMIIMPSERKTEPPPKTGGLAGVIFLAVVAVAGVGGYLWMQNAPPAEEYAVEQSDTPQPYATPQTQQMAMNEASPSPAPAQPQPAPRAAAPVDAPPEPMPEAAPIGPVDPVAPPSGQ